MTDCPPQRLQALRWGFRETLQHVSRLPSYSEFQAHFSGDGKASPVYHALSLLVRSLAMPLRNSRTCIPQVYLKTSERLFISYTHSSLKDSKAYAQKNLKTFYASTTSRRWYRS